MKFRNCLVAAVATSALVVGTTAPAEAAATHKAHATNKVSSWIGQNTFTGKVWYHNYRAHGVRATSIRLTSYHCNQLATGEHGHPGDYYNVWVVVRRVSDGRNIWSNHYAGWYCGQTRSLPRAVRTRSSKGLKVGVTATMQLRNDSDSRQHLVVHGIHHRAS